VFETRDSEIISIGLQGAIITSGGISTGLSTTVNNVAPSVGVTAAFSTIFEGNTATVTGSYTDVGVNDTHDGTIDWGEGSPEAVTLGAGVFTATHTYLDDNPTGTPSDGIGISIVVTDDDTGTGSAGATIIVNNVAPEVATFTGSTIDENGVATVAGSFTDIGSLDTHTVTINWGEGSSSSATVDPVLRTFSASHQYLDDNPTATSTDTYTVMATVTDDDTGTASANAEVIVNNVIPVVDSVVGDTINEGGSATVSGTYSDVGSQDSHTGTINWGEGTTEPLAVAGGGFSTGHVYGDNGSYTVTVVVTDDDTGVSVANTAIVIVNNVDPTLNLDEIGSIAFFAGDAFIGRIGIEQSHDATANDVGSDDLTFTWNGVVQGTYFNDTGLTTGTPDSGSSPHGNYPFNVTDNGQVNFNAPGVFAVVVDVNDDDGGSATDSLQKVITGDCDCAKSKGFWKHEFDPKTLEKNKGKIDPVTLQAYLDIVGFGSQYFSGIATFAQADIVFDPPKSNNGNGSNNSQSQVPDSRDATNLSADKKKKTRDPTGAGDESDDGEESVDGESKLAKAHNNAEQQVLAAWLNFAKGAVDWDEQFDTTGDGTPDMTFETLVHTVEDILGDPNATKSELEYAKDLAETVNKSDKNNPDCDTNTGSGDRTKADTKAGSQDDSSKDGKNK
jgi:hypothetical protein